MRPPVHLRRLHPLYGFRRRRGLSWAVVVLLILLAAHLYRSTPPETASFPFDSDRLHRVERVVDGDTLLLGDGSRVRLIGVNTPETKLPGVPPDPLGLKASEFVRKHVGGRDVTLRFDRERRDRYHRILAYVYVGDWFLNEELILAGYSRAETRFPYSNMMKRRFRLAEQTALEHQRGMWAEITDTAAK